MANRKSQLERAIESLQAKRDILDAAITELQQQVSKKPAKRAPKPRTTTGDNGE